MPQGRDHSLSSRGVAVVELALHELIRAHIQSLGDQARSCAAFACLAPRRAQTSVEDG